MGNPALFGITNSNRDFSKAGSWSKNKFNSSFPASLVAYMGSKEVPCVYLKLDATGELVHDYIDSTTLFGCDPLSPDLYYSFESKYLPFQPYCIGNPPSVDIMLMDVGGKTIFNGFEVKLTTLPDESTHALPESEYGCEMVIRMPSIHFLACSLASMYAGNEERLKSYFGKMDLEIPPVTWRRLRSTRCWAKYGKG